MLIFYRSDYHCLNVLTFRGLNIRLLERTHICDKLFQRRELLFHVNKIKVNLSLYQTVKAHRVVRRRGSHIFSTRSAHRWQ
jgi:hypothetical protein